MNRENVKEVFKILSFAYPKFEVSSEKVDFWQRFLSDQNPATVMKKVEKWVMDNAFPPTISDLREVPRKETKSVLAGIWGEGH